MNKLKLFFIILIVFSFYYLNKNYFFDDTMIYTRYIKNVLEGKGLVYNEGDRYNGLTSPLFTYINIVICYFMGKNNIIQTLNFLSFIYLSASILVFYKIFKNIIQPTYCLFLGFLLIVTNKVFYFCFGMETYLFTFLIGLSIYLFLKQSYFYLFITLTLVILTRSEGFFLVAALCIEHLILKRKFPNLRFFIIPVLLIGLHYSFNYLYFGNIFPDSAKAKVLHGKSGLWDYVSGIKFIKLGIKTLAKTYTIAYYIMLPIIIMGIYNLKNSSINRIMIFFVVFSLSFYLCLNIPAYYWYYIPIYFILIFYFSSGLSFIYSVLIKKNKYLAFYIPIIISSLLIFYNLKEFRTKAYYVGFRGGLSQREIDYEKIGRWLNKNTEKDSSIGVVEIGVIGYFSDRKIIDFCGLATPLNAEYLANKDTYSWVITYKPDYLVTHNPIWDNMENVIHTDFFKKNYDQDFSFPFKDYMLFKRKSKLWIDK